MKHYGHLVKVLHWCADQAMTEGLEKVGLTAAQGRVMGYLGHCAEPPCPRDVEETFHLSHPTVSGILTRLEKKEFIELYPDPADRRCKRIRVLPKGEECRETMHRTIRDMEHRIVEGFSPEEQDQFHGLLLRAIKNMGGGCVPAPEEETKP